MHQANEWRCAAVITKDSDIVAQLQKNEEDEALKNLEKFLNENNITHEQLLEAIVAKAREDFFNLSENNE
jgi:hypothetical protein